MAAVVAGLALLILFIGAAVWYAIVFPLQPLTSALPPLTGAEHDLAARLRTHIEAVASRPHNLHHVHDLEAAAVAIESALRRANLQPSAQVYEVNGRPVRNIEVEFAPRTLDRTTPTLIIGAHYDSADDSPGANDNGTGVAALIELARALTAFSPKRHRIRLVFWVNEEQPWGKTPAMGSWRHAKALVESGERVAGVIALETLGYFSDRPGSQEFPFPFGWIYPDRGNFVAFVGLPGSRSFLRRSLSAFRAHAQFPSIGGVVPGFVPGADLSDHWAYREFGMPALMITDTAPFRNPYYHTPDDLPGTVDYESLARITVGLTRMVKDIA